MAADAVVNDAAVAVFGVATGKKANPTEHLWSKDELFPINGCKDIDF